MWVFDFFLWLMYWFNVGAGGSQIKTCYYYDQELGDRLGIHEDINDPPPCIADAR